ncbi:hypothetical protein [Neobacillus dielmonensis]|uniref:hypothetical protein n=1 Tax=Neobacillus dielmonensis TaxID=1347369 RepID=UPI0005A9705C|nr:hypothetical protein [Neobacillus dielmonensis]
MASPILSPTFHIGSIKIGTIESASCFSIGNNFIQDFKNSKKHNQGLGNIHGDRNNFERMSASLSHQDRNTPAIKEQTN